MTGARILAATVDALRFHLDRGLPSDGEAARFALDLLDDFEAFQIWKEENSPST